METVNQIAEAVVGQISVTPGIVHGDCEIKIALKPDVLVPLMSFEAPPESDHTEDVDAQEKAKAQALKTRNATVRAKTIMQEASDEIREKLAAKGFRPAADSSSPEIVTYSRRWESTPYLFAINDARTFGDYVGPWGRVMEKGLPTEGWVSLADPQNRIGAVYELSRGEAYAFTRDGDRVKVPVKFSTNDGRMFVFLPSKIESVKADAPSTVKRGDRIEVTMTVADGKGNAVLALLPVEIRLFDSAGREIDGGGYVCAEGGVAKVSFHTNLDDAEGAYRLVCKDRASGLTAERTIKVK